MNETTQSFHGVWSLTKASQFRVRRPRTVEALAAAGESKDDSATGLAKPAELIVWLDVKICECLGSILKIADIKDTEQMSVLIV